MQQGTNPEFRRWLADRTAAPMFCLSVVFLTLVAAVLVLTVDAPHAGGPFRSARLDDASETGNLDLQARPDDGEEASLRASALRVLRWTLLALWPLFLVEAVLRITFRDRQSPGSRREYWLLLAALCPPLRLATRHADQAGRLWLPGLGWQTVDEDLRQRLERALSIPMLVIALLILPVLLVEFAMAEQVASRVWLQIALGVGTGLIWFAFAAEFIVMITIADKKLRYCKQHWLDLAIILLPMISFLRSLRVVQAARAARLARLQQLTKMSRVYRLRGLAMRAFRGVLLLELVNRVLRIKPERRLRALREMLEEKEREVNRLRREMTALETLIASQPSAARPEADLCSEPASEPSVLES